MAKAIKCDRCGDFYEHYRMGYMGKYINGISLANTTKDGYRIPMRIFDICPKCCEELIKWLGDENEEGKEDGRE